MSSCLSLCLSVCVSVVHIQALNSKQKDLENPELV